MALSFLRTAESTVDPILFGKVPFQGDFVRMNATHPAALSLDEALQRGMDHLCQIPGWEAGFDRTPALDFGWLSDDQRWFLAGCLVPSQDASGRRYPLVAGHVLPASDLDGSWQCLPVAMEVFQDQLRSQLINALSDPLESESCIRFLEEQAGEMVRSTLDLPLAKALIDRFLRGAAPSVLMPEGADAETGLRHALLNLLFYADFLRRFGSPSVLQDVSLALPATPSDRVLQAGAWLTVLAATGGSSTPWGRHWYVGRAKGTQHLNLFPGQPRQRFVAGMFQRTPDGNGSLELLQEQKAWTSHRLYAETAYALDRCLMDGRLSLHELIEFLRDTCRRLSMAQV